MAWSVFVRVEIRAGQFGLFTGAFEQRRTVSTDPGARSAAHDRIAA